MSEFKEEEYSEIWTDLNRRLKHIERTDGGLAAALQALSNQQRDQGFIQDVLPLVRRYHDEKVTFETFFTDAKLNPNAHLITGVICGYRIEEIENPLTKQVRYLDKLVDELAKGRKMEKILREA